MSQHSTFRYKYHLTKDTSHGKAVGRVLVSQLSSHLLLAVEVTPTVRMAETLPYGPDAVASMGQGDLLTLNTPEYKYLATYDYARYVNLEPETSNVYLCFIIKPGHILSRIYNCTKPGNRPIDNAKIVQVHCTFQFYNCTNCDQLHTKICLVLNCRQTARATIEQLNSAATKSGAIRIYLSPLDVKS